MVPSADGERVLGDLYILYKPRFYLWAIADAAFKLVFTAVLGVLFKDAQQTGLVVAAILCVGLGFFSAVFSPFVHHSANYIVLAMFLAIMATCAEMAVAHSLTDQSERANKLHSVLEMIALALYVLPFAMCLWEVFNLKKSKLYGGCKAIGGRVRRSGGCRTFVCKAIRGRDRRSGARKRIQELESAVVVKVKDSLRAAQLDERRSRNLAMILSDLRPLAERAKMLRNKNGRSRTPRSMASTASTSRQENVGRIAGIYNDAIDAASSALDEFPLALTWGHCIAIESAARELSKLVFEGRRDVMKGVHDDLKGGDHHGVVVLTFANVHELWRQDIARYICAQEADGDNAAVPSMKSVVVCRNAIIALLCPGVHMGSFRMAHNVSGYYRTPAQSSESKMAVEVARRAVGKAAAAALNGAEGGEGGAGGETGATMRLKRSAVVPAGGCSVGNPVQVGVGGVGVVDENSIESKESKESKESTATANRGSRSQRLAPSTPQHREAAALTAARTTDQHRETVEASQAADDLLVGRPSAGAEGETTGAKANARESSSSGGADSRIVVHQRNNGDDDESSIEIAC